MTDKPTRTRIQLDLTERQKEQIREVTGREVNTLELRLQALPEMPHLPRRTGESGERS